MAPGLFQVKAIVPPKKDTQRYLLTMLKELDNQGQIAKRMYLKTVKTWSSPRPVFKVEAAIGKPPKARMLAGQVLPAKPAAYVSVTTVDERFLWTDEGTEPHPITPKKPGGRLFFRSKFVPKTRPGVIGSTKGSIGGDLIVAKQVSHPGTKARGFTKEIAKRRRRYFYAAMRKANSKALRAAGYKG